MDSTSTSKQHYLYSHECIVCDYEHCNKSNPGKRCSRCNKVYYCSVVCQKSHWITHKPYCIDVNLMREWLIGVEKGGRYERFDITNVNTNVLCAICLEETATNPIIVPECRHVFCFTCLSNWKKFSYSNKTTCPVCRIDVERDIKLQIALCNAARASKKGLDFDVKNQLIDSALSDIDDLLKDNEEDLQFLISKIEILTFHRRDLNTAIDVAKKLVDIEKINHANCDKVNAILNKIQMIKSVGDNDEAERLIEVGQRLREKSNATRLPKFTVSLLLAQVYEVAEKWEEALETYTGVLLEMQVLMEDTQSSNIRNPVQENKVFLGICRAAYELGDYDQAKNAGLIASGMNRHFPRVHKFVALAQKDSGDLDAAIKTINRAVLYETPWDDDNIAENKKLFEQLKMSKE